MSEISGTLVERPILEVIRLVHLSGSSGVLEIDPTGHRRRLFFRDGELFLPGGHPLARRLAADLADLASTSLNAAARALRRQRLLELVARIAAVLVEWREGTYTFSSAPGVLPADLVGPVPTRRLLMTAAGAGLDARAAFERLGGEGARLVALEGPVSDADPLGFSAEERDLLQRLRLPMTVGELVHAGEGAEAETLRRLVELSAVGWIAPAQEGRVGTQPGEDDPIVERLEERIASSLEYEPLQLPADQHREKVAALLARFGALDHYELLGLSPSTGGEEVHAAYERLARLVHPSHAARLGLVESAPALRLLFERATRAYATLSDPERRRRYNAEELIDVAPVRIDGRERDEERRALARANYERGIAYAGAIDYHFAISLLEQAVRSDPRAEYWAALAKVQARNPNWIRRAVDSYRAAIDLEPENFDLRLALGQLFEQVGEPERARAQYLHALRIQPENLALRERLARLQARGANPKPVGGGLFDRIFRRGS
jgi:curved DNA-binding protein CbpA